MPKDKVFTLENKDFDQLTFDRYVKAAAEMRLEAPYLKELHEQYERAYDGAYKAAMNAGLSGPAAEDEARGAAHRSVEEAFHDKFAEGMEAISKQVEAKREAIFKGLEKGENGHVIYTDADGEKQNDLLKLEDGEINPEIEAYVERELQAEQQQIFKDMLHSGDDGKHAAARYMLALEVDAQSTLLSELGKDVHYDARGFARELERGVKKQQGDEALINEYEGQENAPKARDEEGNYTPEYLDFVREKVALELENDKKLGDEAEYYADLTPSQQKAFLEGEKKITAFDIAANKAYFGAVSFEVDAYNHVVDKARGAVSDGVEASVREGKDGAEGALNRAPKAADMVVENAILVQQVETLVKMHESAGSPEAEKALEDRIAATQKQVIGNVNQLFSVAAIQLGMQPSAEKVIAHAGEIVEANAFKLLETYHRLDLVNGGKSTLAAEGFDYYPADLRAVNEDGTKGIGSMPPQAAELALKEYGIDYDAVKNMPVVVGDNDKVRVAKDAAEFAKALADETYGEAAFKAALQYSVAVELTDPAYASVLGEMGVSQAELKAAVKEVPTKGVAVISDMMGQARNGWEAAESHTILEDRARTLAETILLYEEAFKNKDSDALAKAGYSGDGAVAEAMQDMDALKGELASTLETMNSGQAVDGYLHGVAEKLKAEEAEKEKNKTTGDKIFQGAYDGAQMIADKLGFGGFAEVIQDLIVSIARIFGVNIDTHQEVQEVSRYATEDLKAGRDMARAFEARGLEAGKLAWNSQLFEQAYQAKAGGQDIDAVLARYQLPEGLNTEAAAATHALKLVVSTTPEQLEKTLKAKLGDDATQEQKAALPTKIEQGKVELGKVHESYVAMADAVGNYELLAKESKAGLTGIQDEFNELRNDLSMTDEKIAGVSFQDIQNNPEEAGKTLLEDVEALLERKDLSDEQKATLEKLQGDLKMVNGAFTTANEQMAEANAALTNNLNAYMNLANGENAMQFAGVSPEHMGFGVGLMAEGHVKVVPSDIQTEAAAKFATLNEKYGNDMADVASHYGGTEREGVVITANQGAAQGQNVEEKSVEAVARGLEAFTVAGANPEQEAKLEAIAQGMGITVEQAKELAAIVDAASGGDADIKNDKTYAELTDEQKAILMERGVDAQEFEVLVKADAVAEKAFEDDLAAILEGEGIVSSLSSNGNTYKIEKDGVDLEELRAAITGNNAEIQSTITLGQ